ncbi:uncharacterized protein LOC129911949 [Episyrphus balteatus]|uniref:uncharacterized protein LOC129911949 n=1 Tax=Episyrphus balteatus TaxID=286459 RepID=UPI0024853026|nr:uncharacterized protein LOC129911949 [Episyrphus balteatus]
MLRLPSRISSLISKWSRNFHNANPTTRPTLIANQLTIGQLPLIGSTVQYPLYPNKNKIINDLPLHNVIIENPRDSLLNEIREIIKNENIIQTPAPENTQNEIQAARLIVIRRRKMKKHKLKKLRKKMKFEWAKVRQRREMRKEKAFQAELISQIKTAEKFSAEQYVMSKLQKANETPIPRFWKGRRLPQFIIKQKLGLE